jgi:hypothetical protein
MKNKPNVSLDREELSILLYALIAVKDKLDPSICEQMDKLVDKLQKVK